MLCFPVLLLSFGLISHPYLISFHFVCLSFSQDTLSETIQSLYCTTNHTNKRNTLKSHIIAPSLPSHYFNWPNLKNSKELQVLWQCHYLFSALQENLGKMLRLTGIAGFYNPKEINVTSVSNTDTWYVQACTRTEAVQKPVFISQRSSCPLIASFHVHFCFAENCSHQEIILIIFFPPLLNAMADFERGAVNTNKWQHDCRTWVVEGMVGQELSIQLLWCWIPLREWSHTKFCVLRRAVSCRSLFSSRWHSEAQRCLLISLSHPYFKLFCNLVVKPMSGMLAENYICERSQSSFDICARDDKTHAWTAGI